MGPPIYKKFFPGKNPPGGRLQFPSTSEIRYYQRHSDKIKIYPIYKKIKIRTVLECLVGLH
jgi:hypothetical protein